MIGTYSLTIILERESIMENRISQTTRLDMIFDDLKAESFLSREDLDRQLRAVKDAAGMSNEPEELEKLYMLLDSARIPYERGLSVRRYEDLVNAAGLPDRDQLEEKIIRLLFEKFEGYVSPSEYMKKIVDRCANPEDHWEKDPLRLRILKQFVKYGGCLAYKTSEGCASGKTKKVVMYGGDSAIRRYLSGKSKAEGIRFRSFTDQADLLEDDIFDLLNVDDIRSMVKSGVISTAKGKDQIKDRRKKYGLLKLADDLAGGHFRTQGATKKGLYLFALVYNMTYVYPDGLGTIVDPDTDIEINLFEKYYGNNLMRFLNESGDDSSQNGEFDLNPTGQGINYKNFAEMIYLYYISKGRMEDDDYTPEKIQDKIRRSDEMITRIRNRQAGKPVPEDRDRDMASSVTVYFRNLAQPDTGRTGSIFQRSEKEFEEFLIRHYDCNVLVSAGPVPVFRSPLLADTDQTAAKREYDALIEDLLFELRSAAAEEKDDDGYGYADACAGYEKSCFTAEGEERNLSENDQQLLRSCSYGLYFEDPVAFSEDRLRRVCAGEKSYSDRKFRNFCNLLKAANRYMVPQGHWGGKVSALFVQDAEYLTRTDMLVAFYYYFNASYGEDSLWTWTSYADFLRDFRDLIDPKLEAAHYQPLNGRNIFDMLVAFSSYMHLTMIG